MKTSPRRITLLTDFGTIDGYAAAMRGVIASLAPETIVEDATHEIAPGDITAAAWVLSRYWALYPERTIHVVVVDPGVGGSRRALAADLSGRYVVAPDNGVITRVLREAGAPSIVSIENEGLLRRPVSATFHGRDVFAPVAAHLANDGSLSALGPPFADPVMVHIPEPIHATGVIRGEVIHVDRFGNLITNVPRQLAKGAREVVVQGRSACPVRRTYPDAAEGECVALIGSAELLEISVRNGSAAASLGAGRGAEVLVRLGGS